ncbi:hypothetical protein PVAND_017024 [Polypedilum vanderplanki]|uniref:BTB domain-containing protein n=1 Tax=Polypedilum vanderplanki TaxID=319348 RepID=A0A9J6BHI8_POLVA|nr:hypothetical protein PVAND_017024 [Polypedilum vanderplanki]
MSLVLARRSEQTIVIESQKIVSKSMTIQFEKKTNDCYDPSHILIKNCDFMEFPQNINNFYEDQLTLEILDCKFYSFKAKYLSNLEYLCKLYIVNCGLKSLESDVFKSLSTVEEISLNSNELEEIGPEIFDGLQNLQFVDLRNNKNIDMVFDATDETTNTLDEIKDEIKLKCKPKGDKNQAIAKVQPILQNLIPLEIFNNLSNIFADPDFKDFTIKVGESSFKIHKILFAARSSTLAEIFKNNPEAQELNLRDISESIFKAVHDFIYKNQLPEDANYIEIFAAAARLKIDDLMKISAENLQENVDEKNAFEILLLSNKFDHDQMRQKSFEFIQNKIFPHRKLDAELAKQPEKLKKLIDAKNKLDQEFAELKM